jgi:hypothetical protein
LAAVAFADEFQLGSGAQVYGDALYRQYGSGARYGIALDAWIF